MCRKFSFIVLLILMECYLPLAICKGEMLPAATDTLSLKSKPSEEQSSVQALVEEEGRTNLQAGDCEVKSELQQTDATEPMAALAIAGTNETAGKITVVERKARDSFLEQHDSI